MWLRQHPELPIPATESGGERCAALTTTRRHDRTTRTGTHTKTEAVNARAASVVRLERPLALGHGQHSSKFFRRRSAPWIWRIRKLHTQRCRGPVCWASSSQRKPVTSPEGDCSRVLIAPCQVKPAHRVFCALWAVDRQYPTRRITLNTRTERPSVQNTL